MSAELVEHIPITTLKFGIEMELIDSKLSRLEKYETGLKNDENKTFAKDLVRDS
jgi:hypothetical protein